MPPDSLPSGWLLPPTAPEAAEAYSKAAKALAMLISSRTITVSAGGQSIALTGQAKNAVTEVIRAKVATLQAELVAALQKDTPSLDAHGGLG